MMVRRGETFTRYKFKQSEIDVINEVVETKGDAEAKILLTQATGDGIAN
jgi:GH35 family endo-1,4-beta-xylanase